MKRYQGLFSENANQDTDTESKVGKYLYHATYRPLLKSIMKHGLDPSKGKKKWEDSEDGIVYLANDPEIAESYAESSDLVNEDWIDLITVLSIETSKIDEKLLKQDGNVRNETKDTFAYHGVISPDAITVGVLGEL